jgi:hypothetical protein
MDTRRPIDTADHAWSEVWRKEDATPKATGNPEASQASSKLFDAVKVPSMWEGSKGRDGK